MSTMEVCGPMDSNLQYLDYLRIVYVINCVLNAVFSVVAISGNLIVLLAIWRTAKLHEPSHLLLGILALTDLAVGAIVQPLYVIYKVAELQGMEHVSCITGVVTNMLANLLSGMSFLTVTLITVDRLLALQLHLRYKAVITKRLYVKITVTLLFVLCIFVSFYPWLKGVAIYFSIVIVPSCFIISTVAYLKIFTILRRHVHVICVMESETQLRNPAANTERPINIRKFRKSVISIAYVQALFLLCFTPYLAALVVRLFWGVTKEWKLAWNIATTVIYINSSLNPFVFCWRLKDIRTAVFRTAKELCGRRDRSDSRASQTTAAST